MVVRDDPVGARLRDADLTAAIELLHASREVSGRRASAALYALAGRDRAVASSADPRLVACRTHAEIAEVLAGSPGGASCEDLLTAGAVLGWNGDAPGTYAVLREAHDRAAAEGRFHLAIGARERLAHHARLFGDLEIARAANEDALGAASAHGLSGWRLRCATLGAHLALDFDDLDRAAELVDEALAIDSTAEAAAAVASAGARHAGAIGDSAALAAWSSPAILTVALDSSDERAAIGATTACLIAHGSTPTPASSLAIALRRALLGLEGAQNAVVFLGLVARWGAADEAGLAVDLLRSPFLPRHRFVEAHALLAHAYVLLREGDRSAAIDSAGDAARAFDAIGLRTWTNEAMLLLVHQDGTADASPRRRPSAISLTRREQQVAHLIRRGASNREVARTLQISEHTVERHVSSILSRLGLRSRWQIVDAPAVDAAGQD